MIYSILSASFGAELDSGRKTGTSHSYNTGISYFGNDLLAGHFIERLNRSILCFLIFAIILNYDTINFCSGWIKMLSKAFTLPDTEEYTGAETNPPASAII